MDELTNFINSKKTIKYCSNCGKKMNYTAIHGTYSCPNCGLSFKDLYGEMKDLLEETPNLSMVEISMILGVPLREVKKYIKNGTLENPYRDQKSKM